ncbi:OmpP1/FadL family transporter [Piscinibacter koreensis]|uniref:OmpP1/FadL family transporter n=1 Tax=Piscinibacter koreensis TaxID=2742824 RepID=UPI001591C5E5|nr:outer membrane protein transport protein [Schlegelella koreensis]
MAAFALPLDSAFATGFFINQQSVIGLGRVGAGSAAGADGPSGVFFNPAGLSELGRLEPEKKTWTSFGLQVIAPRSSLRDDGSTAATPGSLGGDVPSGGRDMRNPGDPTPIGNLFFVRRLTDVPAYVGFGITEPFGLKVKFREDWFGRYDAIESSLMTINLGPVAAWELSREVTLGGGLDVQYARSTLTSAIPNPAVPGGPTPATDGKIRIRGDSWAAGYNLGLLLRPTDRTRVGLHFRSPIDHRLSGSSRVSGFTGALSAANGRSDAKAKLKLPSIVSLGVAHNLTDRLLLLGQVERYGWKRSDEVRVRFDNGGADAVRRTGFRNAWAAALGLEYAYSSALTLRGGVRFDETPTVDAYRDTTLPDQKRLWLGLGASWKVAEQWALDFAFAHARIKRADINVERTFFDGTPLASSARVSGSTRSSVNTLSFALRYAF